jgi:hypothetical protein
LLLIMYYEKAPMLFAELNKGGDITSGLKKVSRSETNKVSVVVVCVCVCM